MTRFASKLAEISGRWGFCLALLVIPACAVNHQAAQTPAAERVANPAGAADKTAVAAPAVSEPGVNIRRKAIPEPVDARSSAARTAESKPVVNPQALETATAPESVGDLGRKECLVFEGLKTFTRAGIVGQLDMRFEFYGRSDPEAPLADYLAWIETSVRQGYQHAGFAKAEVKATPDRAAQRIQVQVTEGPRFKCGAVKVTGLDSALTEQLTNLLQVAGSLTGGSREPGQPSFYWPWIEGDNLPADLPTRGTFERGVVAALGELNRHGAEAQADLAFDEARKRADLLVRIQKPGVASTLDEIEVEGLRVNSQEDLLSFLELRRGMPLVGNVTNDVVRQLFESGRFSGHVAQLTPLAVVGHFKLQIAVFELTNAPALKQEFSAEDKALLKLREWLLGWEKRPEDLVLEARATRQGRTFSGEAALGQSGLAILVRQGLGTNQGTLRTALVAAPEHLGYYSGPRQTKLSSQPKNGCIEMFLQLLGQPKDGHGRNTLTIGGNWGGQSHGTPFSMRLTLAPVAFVAMAHPCHPECGTCRIEGGVLICRSAPGDEEEYEMTAEAATGKLLTWRMRQSTNEVQFQLDLRREEGGFARMLKEVATASADFKNGLDPRHPWSSSLGLLVKDVREAVEQQVPDTYERLAQAAGDKLNARELLELVGVLEDMPWGELLSPMDFFSTQPEDADAGEEFALVQENPPNLNLTSSEWVRWLGGFMLKLDDGLFARGSWPWVIVRDATFLAAGEGRWTTNDTARLAQSPDIGPLGCLLSAQALGRFDPLLALTFTRQGAGRVTMSAFQEDLRTLLRGDDAVPKFFRGVLERAPALGERELRTLLRFFGTNSLPVVLEAVAALKASPNLPPEEALRPVIERHWDKELRPMLLRELADRCLAAYQQATPTPDSSAATAAVGWLREAAESGYAPAQAMLGQVYLRGLGVPADPQVAIRWLTLAAEQNHPHAACDLGRIYAKLGGAENLKQAERWYRVGARDNCSAAEIGIAQLLLRGNEWTRAEQDEAVEWLHKAAEHGSAEAEFYLGLVFEQQNKMDEALAHYRKAATKGVLEAQMKLGDLLSDGVSTKPDYVEAWMRFKQAAEQGDRMAAAQARRVERKLDADQLREAKRRLRQLE